MLQAVFAASVFVFASAMIAGLGGCERETAGYTPPPPPQVTVANPTERTVPVTLDFTGTTRGVESVEVRARVRGFIASKEITEGQRVKKGDLLFVIDPRPFEAIVRQNQAQVESRRAALRLAEVLLTRTAEAVSRSAAAQTELDRVTAERDSARAQLELAEAQLVQSELDLEFTQVRSPIDGRIGITKIDAGQLVGAAEPTLLATVINDSVVLATYYMSEREVLDQRRINNNRRPGEDGRPNIPVLMALANDADYVHEGTFAWADNRVDPMQGTVKVEASFDNSSGVIVPGLFVRLRSIVGEQRAIIVPDVAVQRDANGPYVLVVGADNKVQRRNVITGDVVDRGRMIMAGPGGDYGISLQDRVIINGLQRARPGATVDPVPPSGVTAPAAGSAGDNKAPANPSAAPTSGESSDRSTGG
ncbi:MAG: efflux RND transporter periplasmic adaptor subunit [Planctomycetota bacterium]|nr:efflux RND transporter periplasmic adaptor subunit [Planctomycetota bacterium]